MTSPVTPQKPKRTVSAFHYYQDEVRPAVSAELKEAGRNRMPEVTKEIVSRWKALPEEERKVYQDKSDVDRKRHVKEMTAWVESQGEVSTPKTSKPKVMRYTPRKPTAPKKPKKTMSAFSYYAGEERTKLSNEIKERGDKIRLPDLAKEIAARWKALPDEEKKDYQERSVKDRERWTAENKAFKQGQTQKRAAARKRLAVRLTAKNSMLALKKAAKAGAKKVKPIRARATGKAGKATKRTQEPAVTVDPAVLEEAKGKGFDGALMNLAVRPEVLAKAISARKLLDALISSGGLVNPAKRAVLGD
jgi:hypothetical protein